jgi:hypothetical protein
MAHALLAGANAVAQRTTRKPRAIFGGVDGSISTRARSRLRGSHLDVLSASRTSGAANSRDTTFREIGAQAVPRNATLPPRGLLDRGSLSWPILSESPETREFSGKGEMPFRVEFVSISPVHEKAIFHQLSLARGGKHPRARSSLYLRHGDFTTAIKGTHGRRLSARRGENRKVDSVITSRWSVRSRSIGANEATCARRR